MNRKLIVIVATASLFVLTTGAILLFSNHETNNFKCPFQTGGEPIYCVSIVQLIVDPSRFHNKLVRVTGYLNLEFESNAIYLHKDDWQNHILQNSIWLQTDSSKFQNKTGKYSTVVGRFSSVGRGHLGLWRGEILEIESIN